jgi:hypothetical protein
MGKAYSYVRMSTPEQRKGDSLRRQTELAENYARANNLELDATFKLHDIGVSAFDGSNLISRPTRIILGRGQDRHNREGIILTCGIDGQIIKNSCADFNELVLGVVG